MLLAVMSAFAQFCLASMVGEGGGKHQWGCCLYVSVCFQNGERDPGSSFTSFLGLRVKNGEVTCKKASLFLVTSDAPAEWILSSVSIDSETSMLGRTLKGFRDQKEKDSAVTYLFYNDHPPDFGKSSVGHLKGYLLFDEKSGVWVIHSTPRFHEPDKYGFPFNARIYGHIAMCVTFATQSLNEICKHLLFCNPNIYDYKISPALMRILDADSQSLFSKKPNFITDPPFTRQTTLESLAQVEFIAFAKDNQYEKDIYSDIIGPSLGEDLIVQSWRRDSGRNLHSFCSDSIKVIDVVAINMTVKNGGKGIYLASREDHSKWAISKDNAKHLVCVADLNRMDSEAKRGGGAICLFSKPLRKAFKSIISDTEACPTG
ncbi:deoxyribonuclease-2 [Nephila pilipes]|uniref:Deoxyribonuclease-2 n=1 Tax=Nephila pilipes TaxID=299642 RepID=A0A8X6UMF7_NEPPI|nr:deoxyribonuclease-2 [Nephila pilipes]